MGCRQCRATENLHVSDDCTIIGDPEHIQSMYDQWPHLGVAMGPNPIVELDEHSWMLEFPEETDANVVRLALAEWKDWYCTDGRQIIHLFETRRQEFLDNGGGPDLVLRLGQLTLIEFQKPLERDWHKQHWDSVSADDLRQVYRGNINERTQALLNILSIQGVRRIEIVMGVEELAFESFTG